MADPTSERIVAGEGVSLAVTEAGDPQAPPVVLIHGYPDTAAVWAPVMARLADRFHVIAYDVRGAGGSDAPRGRAAYRIDRLAADFAAVCAALAPDRPVHLVGHDWGGIQGWEFATSPPLRGRIASFTSIAGPALGHAVQAGRGGRGESPRAGRLLTAAWRLRRSWYVVGLCLPGGPTLAWRVLLRGDRWRRLMAGAEGVAVSEDYPAATVAADGRHGANLYRANIPARVAAPVQLRSPHAPVQLIVASGDRFLPGSYYDAADAVTPGLWRRTVAGSHWVPRTHPELIARWIEEFAQFADGTGGATAPRGWTRGGGTEQLAGALALVTGAGSGIGRATAIALAARGARVVCVDRDADSVAATAAGLAGARAVVCDVADVAAVERMAADVLAGDGVPDVVVNNAGIGMSGPFADTTVDDWRAIVDVNLLGVVHGCRLFAAAMMERGMGGQIVNTSSAAAFLATPTLTAYGATKAAVLLLSEGLRAELAPHAIGVTAVCPGIVATNITRSTRYVGRPPAEQARAAERATRLYQRRNYGPERVAAAILAGIGSDRPLVIVTPEARALRMIARLSPRLGRRMARARVPI